MKKTPRAAIEKKIGDDNIESHTDEFFDFVIDDFILEIQNKIDNIIYKNDLKEFIDNEQDPR